MDYRLIARIAIIILCLFYNKVAQCDVIPPNSHFVTSCVKITNIDEYNNVVLLGYVSLYYGEHRFTYQISSTECLSIGYKFNWLEIYAVTKDYIKDKDIDTLDLPNDPNSLKAYIVGERRINPYVGWVHDSIPLSSIDKFYKIAGFTDSTVVLYKWKEITGYNDGTPDQIQLFDYPGDVKSLSQQFPLLTNKEDHIIFPRISIFPNPANDHLNIQIENNYYGDVKIEMLSANGSTLKYFTYYKTDGADNFFVPTYEFKKGIYFFRIVLGEMIETKKVIIE